MPPTATSRNRAEPDPAKPWRIWLPKPVPVTVLEIASGFRQSNATLDDAGILPQVHVSAKRATASKGLPPSGLAGANWSGIWLVASGLRFLILMPPEPPWARASRRNAGFRQGQLTHIRPGRNASALYRRPQASPALVQVAIPPDSTGPFKTRGPFPGPGTFRPFGCHSAQARTRPGGLARTESMIDAAAVGGGGLPVNGPRDAPADNRPLGLSLRRTLRTASNSSGQQASKPFAAGALPGRVLKPGRPHR